MIKHWTRNTLIFCLILVSGECYANDYLVIVIENPNVFAVKGVIKGVDAEVVYDDEHQQYFGGPVVYWDWDWEDDELHLDHQDDDDYGSTGYFYSNYAGIWPIHLTAYDGDSNDTADADFYVCEVSELMDDNWNTGTLYVPLNETIDIFANSNPCKNYGQVGMEVYFPTGSPVWEVNEYAPGADYRDVTLVTGQSDCVVGGGNDKLTFSASVPGPYKIKATCGDNDEGDDIDVVVYTVVDISACGKTEGCFEGYGQRVTGSNRYLFGTGKEFLDGLVQATSDNGSIGNLYIFSHAWLYQSSTGISHGGGFWGQGSGDPSLAYFNGQTISGDHADARDLDDLEALINNESIRFAPDCIIFIEGCHVGEIGSFVSNLSSLTGRTIISAYGDSTEYELGTNWVKFRSAPENSAESNNPDYDGWKSGSTELGTYITVP
jgi:hypothetical protein